MKFDAVVVTRCKNCVHYSTYGSVAGFGWCVKYNIAQMDGHYCSEGEAKTNSIRRYLL